MLLDIISGWTMTSADKAENKLRIETFEVSNFNDTGYCKYSHQSPTQTHVFPCVRVYAEVKAQRVLTAKRVTAHKVCHQTTKL